MRSRRRKKRSSRFRRLGFGLALGLILLASVVLVRGLMHGAPPTGPMPLPIAIDRERAAHVLSAYVAWDSGGGVPRDPRPAHLDLLIDRYAEPLGLEHRVLGGRILLLAWRAGEVTGAPLLLLSHADVVPVADEELASWTYPPFSGEVRDGYVWGRGAIDGKGATVAQLEAIAAMQAAGLAPHRDVILLITPDQETGGAGGVGAMLERYRATFETPWAVLGQGSFIASDAIQDRTLVPVAVAEKRFVTAVLTVVGEASDSSLPRENAAPRVLAMALSRLAELEHPAVVLPATDVFLERISDHVPFVSRLALKNRWLFGPLVRGAFSDRPAAVAMLHDTVTVTSLRAGISDAVVPARASAHLSLRLLPGSDLATALARMEAAVDDPRVTMEVLRDDGVSPTAPIEGEVWTRLESALASAYPGDDAIITPVITPVSCDARYFAREGVPAYRLTPFVLDANERGRVHGVDERISMQNLQEAARVYAHLMRYW